MMARLTGLAVAGLLAGLGTAAADGMLARLPTADLGFALMLASWGVACLLGQRAAWAALPPRADLPPDTPPHDWWDPRLPWLILWVGLGGRARGALPSRALPADGLGLRVALGPPLCAQVFLGLALWMACRAAWAIWAWAAAG
jgi:hypothetical protein